MIGLKPTLRKVKRLIISLSVGYVTSRNLIAARLARAKVGTHE
jgi:hypothetical protein